MSSCLIEEMRPGQIQEIVGRSAIVFIPVSPRHEWHSYHLPVGTDGIIAEEVARLMAERFGGAYFRALPLGLDAFRAPQEKQQWGLEEQAQVFGMNFPGLPVASEYCPVEQLASLVAARLKVVRETGFRFAFLINHHGGSGQAQTLEQLAREATGAGFHCECLLTHRFGTFRPDDEHTGLYLSVGGHAGLCETHQLMAFRPELVDLTQLPEGPLSVAQMGILHDTPQIPPQFNPRRALALVAQAWRRSVLENMARHISQYVPPQPAT